MDEHPLVRFVDGPSGRRARLVVAGIDVWEVISVVRDNAAMSRAAAAYLELSVGLVQATVLDYGPHTEEVDEWIELNALKSEGAHAAWVAGQSAAER